MWGERWREERKKGEKEEIEKKKGKEDKEEEERDGGRKGSWETGGKQQILYLTPICQFKLNMEKETSFLSTTFLN